MLAKSIFLQKAYKQKRKKNSSCFSHEKQRKQTSKFNNQSKQQANGSYGMKRTEVSSIHACNQVQSFWNICSGIDINWSVIFCFLKL